MTKIYQTAIFLLLFAVTFVTGCRHASYSPKLEAIDRLIADDPTLALAKLSKISPDSLSEADRNLLSLLTIKAADKNYVRHSSDSLILTVIDYYDRHDTDPRHAEALYYGGRVYSDIGDYPSALRYFQAALDKLPEDTENLRLRNTVLSQTGRLLNSLRLHKQAIPYIEDAIEIEKALEDSLRLLYDLELLGQITMHDRQFSKSDSLFRTAMNLSKAVKPEYYLREKMFLAGLKNMEGKTDSALILIRNIPESIDSLYLATALSYATDIYKMEGRQDSALIYATQFIRHKEAGNLRVGYSILLSDSIRNLLTLDSIYSYIDEYRELTDKYMRENGDRATLIQNSMYNYQKHQRERVKAEESKYHMTIAITAISIVLAVFIIISLVLKVRNTRQKIRLYSALEKLNELKELLEDSSAGNMAVTDPVRNNDADRKQSEPNEFDEIEGVVKPYEILRNKKRKDFLSMSGIKDCEMPVPDEILKSDAYAILAEKINSRSHISDSDEIWEKLEMTVHKASPDFKHILTLLSETKLKEEDFHTLLLIKCGVNPTDVGNIQALSKGGVSSRRRRLSVKLFGTTLPNDEFDKLIRFI